jgi:PIN domain nuclease of toxin-antitoxin system
MILLDTQTLIWWSSSRESISRKAFKKINVEVKKGKVLVSSISIWEVYLLLKKKRLKFKVDISTWLEKVEQTPYFEFIPVDNKIAAKSVMLPGKLHQDPADRIIIATALTCGAKLITSDKRILKYPFIQSVW